ncbi:carboxypeptidase-like regulatory domain-containing protein [Gimesia sp.]|uniref:carboxypeptidase-like regulatory domain-containing protein n=1 Tax=Gimesia sp. TaxID=2024833 RepID=UPI003A90FA3F
MKLRAFLLLMISGSLVGCGGAPAASPLPETVPVTGVVTLDGAPIAAATVTFIPQGQTKGVECLGTTDEGGKYQLQQQHGAEGAPPGNYKVVISRLLRGDGTPLPEEGAGAGGIAVESLPARYSNVSGSRLTAVVPEAGGEFDFDLQNKK